MILKLSTGHTYNYDVVFVKAIVIEQISVWKEKLNYSYLHTEQKGKCPIWAIIQYLVLKCKNVNPSKVKSISKCCQLSADNY